MSGVQKFEDLIAWQKARALTRSVYEVTKQGAFANDYGLANQIQRAAVSIMSNIAEGHERDNPNEFYRFLGIAKGSCAEVRCQLYVAHDVQYITDAQFQALRQQAEELGKIIGGLRKAVAQRR